MNKLGSSRTSARALLLMALVFVSATCLAQAEGRPEVPAFGAELLRDSLESNFNGYINNVWGTITALLVAIGWLLTSEKSRVFLSRNPSARWTAITAALAILTIHCLTLAEVARASERLTKLILADPYFKYAGLTVGYLQRIQVPWHYVLVSIALDGTLFVLLIVLLYKMGDWSEP
jgi:hypothetical protein